MAGYRVGRSTRSDIVLADASVSRDHAELTPLGGGRYRLADSGSRYGLFVKKDGAWHKVGEADVAADEAVMLGNYRTTPKLLMQLLGKGQSPTAAKKTTEASGLRRLAAILAADVVGYSRLMGADEGGTLAALKACRRELFDPSVERHRGRIFKVVGDGILAEFASVVDAVRCALEIQTAMVHRQYGPDADKRLRFRIGINIGDVIADGDDIYGDGVNIAARLESIAEPGGLCISGPVYDQIKNKLDLGYHDLGQVEVKNISDPLRVYKVFSTASGRVIPS